MFNLFIFINLFASLFFCYAGEINLAETKENHKYIYMCHNQNKIIFSDKFCGDKTDQIIKLLKYRESIKIEKVQKNNKKNRLISKFRSKLNPKFKDHNKSGNKYIIDINKLNHCKEILGKIAILEETFKQKNTSTKILRLKEKKVTLDRLRTRYCGDSS